MRSILIEAIEAVTIGVTLLACMALFVVGMCMFDFWGFVLTCVSVGAMTTILNKMFAL